MSFATITNFENGKIKSTDTQLALVCKSFLQMNIFCLLKLLFSFRFINCYMNQRLGLEHSRENVGKLLRSYRQHATYKSEFVAKHLRISIANYSKLENGKIDLTDARLILVCKMCEITPPGFYLHFKY